VGHYDNSQIKCSHCGSEYGTWSFASFELHQKECEKLKESFTEKYNKIVKFVKQSGSKYFLIVTKDTNAVMMNKDQIYNLNANYKWRNYCERDVVVIPIDWKHVF